MNVNLNVPLSSALFTVDSRDGIRTDPATGFIVDAQNPYDIQIYKNQQLFSGAVQRIALTEINMPFNVPNVNPYNNVLYLERITPPGPTGATGTTGSAVETFILGEHELVDELGETISTDLGIGFYTPEELATVLQTKLNLGGGVFGVNWTVTYAGTINTIANYKTFNIGNTSVPFRINPKFGQPKGSYTAYDGITTRRSSTLAEMMGFNNAGQDFKLANYGNYASMLYTNYVDVVSPFLSKNMEVRDTSSSYFNGSDIVARMYISREGYDNTQVLSGGVTTSNILGTRPFHLHYNFPVPKQIRWNPNEFLPSCNLKLQDMYGNVLYGVKVAATSIGNLPIQISGNSNWVEMNFLISEIN